MASTVARRIAFTADIEAESQRSKDNPLVPGWRGTTLAGGYPGLSLLHLYVARSTPDGQEQRLNQQRAVECIRLAARHTSDDAMGPGLWNGSCGLALALADCCREEPRFAPALTRLHAQVAEQVLAMHWPREAGKVATSHYDIVSGAAGVLMQLCTIAHPTPAVRAAAEHARDYLLWLSEPERAGGPPWRWLITPDYFPPGIPFTGWRSLPHGYLDVGTAHGAAGVLAALAAAWRAGYRCRRQRDAMERLASWILTVRTPCDRGGTWPAFVPVTETEALGAGVGRHRSGWCYGSTGIAAALLSAANATDDSALRRTAVDAFETGLGRDTFSADSQSLCHGLAGLLVGCREFTEAGSRAAEHALPTLTHRLLGCADLDLPFIFRDPRWSGGAGTDLTLLNGAPGMALALLASVDSTRPAWFTALFGH
ncbi:lanthionine synthetase LanC family protein [Streptomyces rimosus]|uniref:lanthionine synthetase LanC family protein n=1 Tax=Streptomyces rimosus TaxID=1927 RepID=UPI0007C74D96|nr:lanthionine synthetase LanC family protein [Streptomyces rimosus]